ncbi:hypothetical protein D9M72_616000 [compost metagenome]
MVAAMEDGLAVAVALLSVSAPRTPPPVASATASAPLIASASTPMSRTETILAFIAAFDWPLAVASASVAPTAAAPKEFASVLATA